MMAHQTKQATPIRELSPDVPEDLVEVVDRLMQKTPEARFPQSIDVVEALRPLAAPTPLTARALDRMSRPNPDPARVNIAGTVAEEPDPLDEPLVAVTVAPEPQLPTRRSVRPRATAEAVRTPADVVQPKPRPHNPFLIEEPEDNWIERLGPLGVIVGAILAASGTWVLSMYLFQ
jgi:hypothetical protein